MTPTEREAPVAAGDAGDDVRAPASAGLARSTAVVALMTLASRVLGLARDIVIANVFGARFEADAFFVAFKIPNLFRRLFAEGAFSQGFVPVLAELRAGGDLVAVRSLVSRVAGLLALVLFALAALGALGAEQVLWVFAPGFGGVDSERGALAAQLLRLTFWYLPLISLTALCAGVLNSYGRFAVPAFTPVWLNVCLILAVLGLAPRLQTPALALGWGVLAAGIVQLLFQFPSMARLGLLPVPRPSVRDAGVRRVLTLMLPAAFGASVGQINLLIDTLLASLLVTGSVSWLYYADRLMELPLGIFAIALATVLLPQLSHEHATADPQRFARTLGKGLRLALLLTVPAAAALVVLAAPLIATLFGYGAMGGDDVAQAAAALRAYALGLLGFTVVKILAPGYFARQDTRAPVRIGVIALGANLVLNLTLIGPLAHVGLALATSLAACLNAGLLLRGLRARGDFDLGEGGAAQLWRVVAAAVVMAAVLFFARPTDGWWIAAAVELRIGVLAGLVLLGLACYAGALAVLGLGPRRLLVEYAQRD